MAFNAFFKKGRLIWDEQIPSALGNDCLSPAISFDRGYSWMDLGDLTTKLRNNEQVYGGKIVSRNNGFKQVDISFGFTPMCIPSIDDYELEPDSVNGLDPGTYYFAVGCLNHDTPGMLSISSGSNYYATGDSANGQPISRLVPIDITTKSKVKLYVNYPPFTRGLCVYYGKDNAGTINLELYLVTNFVQLLSSDITPGSSTIVLANKYPLPKVGIVKIENEYIRYSDCTWNSTNSKWELTGLTRGILNTSPAAHTNPLGGNLPIYLALYDGGIYGELPPRVYSRPKLDPSLVQYINFDKQQPIDLIGGTNPSVAAGTVNYSSNWKIVSTALNLSGSGFLTTNYDLTANIPDEGSIHFYISFEGFNSDQSSSKIDPFIFGSETGLWMKISRITNKPYIGYNDIQISSPEDFRVPSLTKNDYDRIGLTWQVDSNNMMVFKLTINGYPFITKNTDILKYSSNDPITFNPGILFIGGTSISPGNNTCFIGYIDDWRIYNKALSYDEFQDIHAYLMSYPNIYSGIVTIDENFYNYNTTTNTELENYEPLIDKIFDISTATYMSAGHDLGVYYDDWIIKKLLTSSDIASGERIVFPIDSDTIKIRFNMKGDSAGEFTPILKNISLIISEDSLG